MDIDIDARWRELIRRLLPDLVEGVSFEFTSPINYNYNCLSWALSCNTVPFENYKGAYWPWKDVPDDTPEGWAEVCRRFGFASADSAELLEGYEKIAILRNSEGDLHAARQDRTGRWKSKLGVMGPDIDHDGLACLKEAYGEVVYILQRRREDWP